MTSGARRRLCVTLALLLASLASPQTQPPDPAAVDLGQVFAKGPFLQDQNDDGVIDAIRARIVVPSAGTPEDIAAGANIAARLGFEAAAFTPGLGAFDSDTRADQQPLILIGRTNSLIQRLISEKKLDLGNIKPGQGTVAFVPAAFGGNDALVVAGADDAGTAAAAAAASARLPYLWQLRSDSLKSVQEDLRRVLAGRGVRVVRSAATRVVYDKGKEQVSTLALDVDVSPGSEASAATVLEEIARAHVVGQADFTDRRADALNYHSLETLEVRLSRGRTVRIDRFGPPYRSRFPRNPWTPPVEAWSLASIFTTSGILGDSRGDDLIADETETALIVGEGAGRAVGAIDLAARIALESTGASLPLARVESEIADPSTVPNPIVVGPGKLAAVLPSVGLNAGEGSIRIVPRAFGSFPAVLVTGADAAGVNAAAFYFARSVPHLWKPRRGEVTFADIEDEFHAFLRVRSSAGQAAAGVAAIEAAVGSIEEEVETIDAKVYLEEESPQVAAFLESLLKKRFQGARVAASAPSRYGPVTIFEDSPDLGWEVDELRRRFAAEVLPKIGSGSNVRLEVLLSEGPQIRREIEAELRQAVKQAGASDVSVRVICAYKQGFSWLADYVLPALKTKSVDSIAIRFPTARPPDPSQPWYGLPIRWLQELFPIDEILARELKIGVDATRFQKVDDGPIVYRVEARDRAGRPVYSDEFSPRFVEREYFPQKPTARIHYTTAGLLARVNGQVVADFNVRTDPERFWDYYQTRALPRMMDYVREYTGGRLGPENQPFFRDLIFDITMSEPDFRLDVDEERISSLDSLHEDLMFDTIDFWSIFSGNRPGSRDVAPGRIMPMIHPVQPGRAPRVAITFKGNNVPTPRVVLSYRTRGGATERRTIQLTDAGVGRPNVTAVRVRAGADGVASVTATVGAGSFEQASSVARRVEALTRIQTAGGVAGALAYAGLGELHVEVGSATATVVRSIRPTAGRKHAALPLKPAGPGQRIVTWDHVIGPAELEDEILPRFRNFPEINSYVAGRTYRGRNVWAMDVMLPIQSEIWSQAKATALKPVLLISTRQHSNEVSATSAALRLAELLATDPEYRKYLKRMNIAYHPMENPDGAANHQEFYKLQPTYILHAGYWSSVARDVGAYVWDEDPLLPEALVRRKLYYTWLPDIYMNPHGYPSHEWVHQFAGYKVPWFMAFWIPRGYHINLHHIDDPNFPDHKPVGLELRERIIEEVQGVPAIRATNERLVHRFEKYARRYEPDPFRLEIYKGMNILFDHSYSFAVGGPFSREIYVNSLWGRPRGDSGDGGGGREGRSFLSRHPEITVLDLGCDMPDETASPEWMEKMAARGQFGYLMANVKLLHDSRWEVKRFEEDFRDGVRLSFFRPRPVKAARGGPRPATSSQ